MAKKNLATLLKELRPFLPGNVEKLKGTISYIVDGKVLITPEYYCTYVDGKKEQKEQKARECFPVSIFIEPYGAYIKQFEADKLGIAHYGNSPKTELKCVSKKRATKKRQDDTFNYETVALNVTKCLQDIDDWGTRRLELKAQEADYEKAKKELAVRIAKNLPSYMLEKPAKLFREVSFSSSRKPKPYIRRKGNHEEDLVEVGVDGYLSREILQEPPTFDLRLFGLSESDLWFVLEKIEGLDCIQELMEGTTNAKAK